MEDFLIQYLTSKPGKSPDVLFAVAVLGILWANTKWGLLAKIKIKVKLPKILQPVPPVLLCSAAVGLRAYFSGVRGEDLWFACWREAFGTSAVSIALWHDGVKRLLPAVRQLLPVLLRLLSRGRGTGAAALLLVALAAPSLGCSVSLEQARARGAEQRRAGMTLAAPSSRCESLDSQHRWGGATAAAAAFVAGGSGLAGVEVDKDQRELRQGLAVAAVGFAALSVGAELYARDAAATWAEECHQ